MIDTCKIDEIRLGWVTDKYFLRTQEILLKDNYDKKIHYQIFPRKDNLIVCGISQVTDIIAHCSGYYKDKEQALDLFKRRRDILTYGGFSNRHLESISSLSSELDSLWISKAHELKLYVQREGFEVNNGDIVIGIIGNPKYFAHLETPILGVLAQQTAVATSVYRAKKAMIGTKRPDRKLMFFPARFRHYNSQEPDGYAAIIGGADKVSTDANGGYFLNVKSRVEGSGTIPHLLIAAYGGNTSLAASKFDEYIDEEVNRIILVDWDNNCIATTLKCIIDLLLKNRNAKDYNITNEKHIEEFLPRFYRDIPNIIGEGKGKIFAVRFDTSGQLVDKCMDERYGQKGVCPELIYKAREKFDSLGLKDLKIMISGGFDEEKLIKFQDTPYDMVGIGSSIVNKFSVDFTADAVKLDSEPCSKVGRKKGDWSGLTYVNLKI